MTRAAWVLGICCFFMALDARAALTDSEQAQIVSMVREGAPTKVARVRALLGRPDLTAAEVADPLIQALRGQPFDEAHASFAQALLYGVGAAASRDQLALGLASGLLARVDKILSELPHLRPGGPPEGDRRRVLEALQIHGFVSTYLASPVVQGAPTNVRDETRRALLDLYHAHVIAHSELFTERSGWPPLLRLRVQVELTLTDLGRGVVEPRVLADWLGLADSRRLAFERLGILIDDGNAASPARLESAAHALVQALPRLQGYSVWWLNKARLGPLATEGRIAGIASFLSATPHEVSASAYWPSAGDAKVDSQLAEVALSIARLAVTTAFAEAPGLRDAAGVAADHAVKASTKAAYLAQDLLTQPEGSPQSSEGLTSPELFATYGLRSLLLDVPLTLKVATAAANDDRPEPLEQVALALSILASTQGAKAGEVVVPALDGAKQDYRFSNLKIEAGLVTAFTLGERSFALSRADDGSLSVEIGKTK